MSDPEAPYKGDFPAVHDEAADSPRWLPALGFALLCLLAFSIVWRAATREEEPPADAATSEGAGAGEAAPPTAPPTPPAAPPAPPAAPAPARAPAAAPTPAPTPVPLPVRVAAPTPAGNAEGPE